MPKIYVYIYIYRLFSKKTLSSSGEPGSDVSEFPKGNWSPKLIKG